VGPDHPAQDEGERGQQAQRDPLEQVEQDDAGSGRIGGGDAGGIIITAHGIKRIPPFDPGILRQFKALNGLVQLGNEGTLGREVEQLTSQLTENLLATVEKQTGAGAGSQVVYMDVDDGFVCGSTGKPPIPFPHHLLSSLLQSGRLQQPQLAQK